MSQRAQRLLRVELGDNYDDEDYDLLISNGFHGYTDFYLDTTVNLDTYSTRAKGDVIVELTKCDLEKGTRIELIVHDCCLLAPIKVIIEKLISFSIKVTGETTNEMMTKILEYQNDAGWNCLLYCYEMLVRYKNKVI